MLRSLRRRLGVATPKVAIRTEWPLHWRVLSVLVLSAVALALAGWIYDAGRRFAGFDHTQSGEVVDRLQQQVVELTAELAQVKAVADSSEARLQVEATAQERLALAVKSLEEENARLRSELAVFESLAGNDQAIPKLTISRFEVIPGRTPYTFEYRLLTTKSGPGGDRHFKGQLELIVASTKPAGVDNEVHSRKDDRLSQSLQFKMFKRVDGAFSIADGMVLESVEARLIEDGQVKANQRFNVAKTR